MQLKTLNDVAATDMECVNELIKDQTVSDARLICEVGNHVINNGGKRLRSLIVILVARALGYHGHDHIIVAALIELLHSASLMHDDVVDEARYRRGRISANVIYGNKSCIRVGNYFCTRAFRMMVNLSEKRIASLMTEAANTVTEGEILQLANLLNINTTPDDYFNIIYSKTGKLFEVASQSAAVTAQASPEKEE